MDTTVCPACIGSGEVYREVPTFTALFGNFELGTCDYCYGRGQVPAGHDPKFAFRATHEAAKKAMQAAIKAMTDHYIKQRKD